MTGHMKEAQFPFGVALAALAIDHGVGYSPVGEAEHPFDAKPEKILVTAIGHHQFEGMALVSGG